MQFLLDVHEVFSFILLDIAKFLIQLFLLLQALRLKLVL
jgi:hypothetical protein